MTHFSAIPPLGSAPSPVSGARRRLWASSALAAAAVIAPGVAMAGPTDGKVAAGDVTITQSGAVTTITQKSARGASEWGSFDTAVGDMVNIDQVQGKTSTHIARVTGDLPTEFRGELLSQGNVWIINRSGITFHDTARVNVGGLVATTSDIDTAKFMAGSNKFDIPGKPGAAVVNKGAITFADAGLAALVGAQAANEGVIYGRVGAVAIEGRQTFAVDVSGGDGILALETSADTAATLSASNTGLIDAGGSYVVISAEETAAALESLAVAGGTIEAGAVDGHLGQVAIEGRTAIVSGEISAAGGDVDVRGDDLTMTAAASIDVSGQGGGGTVALGGGLRGEGRRADTVVMKDGATIAADGLGDASGGLVTLWATDYTNFAGEISTRGGDLGGDGGFVEVSAKGAVRFAGSVVALAPFGTGGTLLIDPANLQIVNGGSDPADPTVDIDDRDPPVGGLTTVDPANIAAHLGGTLILEAINDIRVVDAVSTIADLTLRAGNDITVDADLVTTGSLTLSADHDFTVSSVGGTAGGAAADDVGNITINNGAAVTGTTGLTLSMAATTGVLTVTGNSTITSGIAFAMPTTVLSGTAAASFVTLAGDLTQAGDFTAIGTTSADFQAAGAVDLTTGGFTNDILSLSGSAGADSTFTLGSTVAFGFDAAGVDITLTTTGAGASVTTNAGEGVVADTLTLAVDGTVALTEASNLIGAVDGTTSGTFALVNDGDLDLGFATTVPTAIDVTTTAGSGTGALTQSTDISSALTLDLAGGATLTRAGNTFTSLAADTGAASSFTTAATLDLGGGAFTGLTAITVTGAGNDLTQSNEIAATGGGLSLNIADQATLNDFDNNITTITGSTGGAAGFTTSGNLSLAFASGAGLTLSVGQAGVGDVTSGGAVTATGLTAFVEGDLALGNPGNAVGTLQGSVQGDLTFVDSGALDLDIDGGTIDIRAGGAITDSGGGVQSILGGASFSTFVENTPGDVSDDGVFNITLDAAATSFAGDLSVSGAAVVVAATGALDVVDAYAAASATFESDAALTLTRVAVGTEAGAAGADLTIDAPGDLLGIGTSVIAADVIAADVTLGAAGSVAGTAVDLGAGAVGLTRFTADTVSLADAASTAVGSGVVASSFDFGDSGALTVTSMDLSGFGLVTLAQTAGTLTVDGLIADSLDLSADDVRLGFVNTTGGLDVAATGSILTLDDASIVVPGNAVVAAPVLTAAQGPDVTDAAAAYAAPTRLLDIDGSASFDAPGDIFLVNTSAGGGFQNDFKSLVMIEDSTGGGAARAALQDANDIGIARIGASGGFALQDVALEAGTAADQAGSITQSDTIHVTGTLTAITGDDGVGGPLGDVVLTLDNELNDVAVRAHDARIGSATDMALAGTLDGDATVTGIGAAEVSLNRLTAVNAIISGATANVLNSALSGTLSQTTSGAGNIAILSSSVVDGVVTLNGQGTTQVFRSALGGLDATVATGVLYLEDSVLGAVDASAGSGLIDNISATDFSLVTAGAIELGPATIANDLALESFGGSILSADSSSGGGSAHAPGAVVGGGVVPVTFGIDTSTAIGNVADGRVQFTSAGISRPGTTPTAAGDGLIVGGNALFVTGDVQGQSDFGSLIGGLDVVLAPGADGLVFDFQGAVTARVDGDFTIHDDAGGILFDVPAAGVLTPSGNAIVNEDGGSITENAALHVTGNLSVTTTGAGGHVLDAETDVDGVAGGVDALLDSVVIGGTADFNLSGDLDFDAIDGNSTHSFGGAVTIAAAQAVTLGVDGNLTLGDVTADSLTVRAAGNIDDGTGTLDIAGAASFAALDDANTADRADDTYFGVSLDNATHDFDGDVSAAGSFVDIRAADAMTMTDVWGDTGVFVSAAGDLTLTRIAAGTPDAPSGPTFAIIPAAIDAAADGAISVTDVIASALTLTDRNGADGSAGLGSPTGDVAVTRFAVDTLDFGTPAAALTLSDGVLTGALVLNAPNDLTVINIDTGGAAASITAGGTATVSGLTATDLTITAADARLGFLDVAGALIVDTTGTIAALPDADLSTLIPDGSDIVVAAPDLPLSVPSSDSTATGVIEDVTIATTAMSRLIEVGGPTSLRAATSIVLAGTPVGGGFENDHLQVRVQDADGGGTPMNVILEDANDLALAGFEAGDVAIRIGTDAGVTGDLTQFTVFQSSGTASFIVEDDGAGNRGAVTLTNANVFNDVALSAGSATLFDDGGFDLVGADLDGALIVNSQTGPLGLADVVAGSIAIDTFGAVTGQRIETAGALSIATDGALSLTDVVALGAADLSAGAAADLALNRFAMGALDMFAGGALTVENGSAGAIGITSGATSAGLSLRNVSAGSIDATVSGGIEAAAVRAIGDMTLFATTGGDVDLGRIAVGGALAIETVSGAITTRDGTDAARFSSPGSAVTVNGAQALTIGLDASGVTGVSDDRVQTTLAGSGGAAVASPAVTEALEVTNGAYFRAIGGDIGITTADDGALATFGGGVMLTTDGAATIEAAGDLTFAQTRATTLSGGGFIPDIAVFTGGALLARANADASVGTGADIAQTGFLDVGGTSSFITGVHSGGVVAGQLGTITLTDADNSFGAAVSALGNDVAITGAGDLTLDAVRAIAAGGGAGAVTADAGGALVASDVTADGAAGFASGGAMTLSDVDAGAALTGDATGDLGATDVAAAGAIDLASSAGAAIVLRADGDDAMTLAAATTLNVTDSGADGATILTSGGAMTLDTVAAGSGTLDADAGGDVLAGTLSSDGAMSVTSSGGAVTVAGANSGDIFDADAAGALQISDIDAAGAVTADSGAGAMGLLRVAGATLAANAGGALVAQDVGIAGDAALTSGNSTAGATAGLTDVAAGGALSVASSGDLTGADVQSAGAMTMTSSLGAVSLTGLEGATTLTAGSATGMIVADANVGGDAGLSAGGDMDLDRIAAGGALTAAGGGDIVAADLQSADAMDVASSGGSVQARRVHSADALAIAAAGVLEVDRAIAQGAMQLSAGTGDLRLSAIEAATTLAAESAGGAIRTFATAAGDGIAGPAGVADGFDGVSSGLADASGLSPAAADQLIDVTGAAAFRAGGDIALARAGGLDNLFAAGVAAEAGGGLLIHHDGDLSVGTGGVPAFASGAVIADGLTTTGASRTGHTRLELRGPSLTTGAGAVYDIDGDFTIAAGLDGGTVDIDIDNLLAVATLEVMAEGGNVDIDASAATMGLIALADDINLAAAGDVNFGSIIARRLIVDATSPADARTIGDATLTPVRLGVDFSGTNGAAVLNDTGTGAADYALSASAAAAMASVPSVIVTERLRLAQSGAGATTIRLDDFSNMLPADVSVNVGGSVGLYEERVALPAAAETYAVSLGLGETDLLQFSELVSGGDVYVYSVDQMQFMGDIGFVAGANVDLWLTSDASIIFRGDVGGIGGPANMLVETLGDIYFFGTVGIGGPGAGFQRLGQVTLRGTDIIAGASPADLASFTGRIEEADLDAFVDNLGEIGVGEPIGGVVPGPLGEVVYLIDDGNDKIDYVVANQIDMQSDGGDLLFVINREDAGGAFEDALSFFGVDVANGVRYGPGPQGILPARVEMYGAIANDRSRAAGIRVNGPIGTTYFFNGCLVRQTSTCTNLGTSVSVPPLPPIDVPVFELATLDLNELFGAIGNEDLWRLPPAYISDEDEQEGTN